MTRIKGLAPGLLVISILIAGCSQDKTSEQYYDLGLGYQQSDDPKAAIIEYKNSIRQDPANNIARLALGKLYLDNSLYAAAKKELVKAGRDESLQQEALIPLAMATFKLDLHQEMLELPLLTSGLPPHDLIIGYVLRGQSLMATGETEQALAEYSLANDINEQALYARLGQAMSASAKADTAKAIALVKSLLEDQPEMDEAMLLYGRLSHSAGDFDSAIAVYDKYIAGHKSTVNGVNLLLADSLLSNNNMTRAKAELNKLLARNNKHPVVNTMLARIAYQEFDYETAQTHALKALETLPNNFMAKLMAAMSTFKLSKHEVSYYHFSRIEKQISGMFGPQMMQIINRIKRGDINEARDALSRLAVIDQKNVELYLLAAHEFTIAQDYRTGLALLKQARPFLSDDNNLTLKIGLLKIESGDATGLDDLATALFDPKLTDKVVSHVIKTFIAAKRIEDLQKIASDLKVKFNDKPYGWDIAAVIALHNKDYDKAEKLYHTNLDKFPDNTRALFNLSKLMAQKGDIAGAMVYVDKVLALQPDYFTAIQFKARLIFRQTRDIEQYKMVFKDAFKAFPDSEILIIEMATIHAAQNELKPALELLESIKSRDSLSEHYWSRYGDLLAMARQPDKALAIYQQWAQRKPNSPVPVFKQIVMTDRLGRYKDGLRLVEQAAKKFGQLKNLEGLKISLMILDGQLGTARRIFNDYKRTDKDSPYISGLEGELLFFEKNYQQAKTQLINAYSSSKRPRYAMLLAKANVALGDSEQAVTVLNKHLELDPLNRRVKSLLANIYVDLKSPLAVSTYGELVKLAPDNPLYLNNLAWSLSENGQHQQALIHIENAVKIMSGNPHILDTYGIILLRLKQYPKAGVQFEKAISLAPESIEFVLHNVELLIELDKKQQAKRLLDRIGTGVPDTLKQQFELLMQQAETS